jgi:hypothetical protein
MFKVGIISILKNFSSQQKTEEKRTCPNMLRGYKYLDMKQKYIRKRKLMTNICHEHGSKSPQQHTS